MKTPQDFERMLKCVEGTFAAEGMKLSQRTKDDLLRLAQGKVDYRQLIEAAKQRHTKIEK